MPSAALHQSYNFWGQTFDRARNDRIQRVNHSTSSGPFESKKLFIRQHLALANPDLAEVRFRAGPLIGGPLPACPLNS
jgi:hypothetical protein